MKKWINQDKIFNHAEIPKVSEKLEPGVYELGMGPAGFFLRHITDKFELPEKVYGIEKDLVERIVKTHKTLDKNFGVVLNGLKGTGKTVTAKLVCNMLKLPVILVNAPFQNMGAFINEIDQDVVMMFDEFEKTYSFYREEDEDGDRGKGGLGSLLTLMDGVFTTKYKRLFILTTNEDRLPDQFISRPTRIRYIKHFADLPLECILEILNDKVVNKKLIPDLTKLLSNLEIITVDIVKSIAEEANIYNSANPEFYKIFNVKKPSKKFEVWIAEGKKKPKLIQSNYILRPDQVYEGYNFYFNGISYTVEEVDKINSVFGCRYYPKADLPTTAEKVAELSRTKSERKVLKATIHFKPEEVVHRNMLDLVL